MSFDKEWEVNSSYVHFFEDDGIYRMYYIAWDKEKYVLEKSSADDKKLRCSQGEGFCMDFSFLSNKGRTKSSAFVFYHLYNPFSTNPVSASRTAGVSSW